MIDQTAAGLFGMRPDNVFSIAADAIGLSAAEAGRNPTGPFGRRRGSGKANRNPSLTDIGRIGGGAPFKRLQFGRLSSLGKKTMDRIGATPLKIRQLVVVAQRCALRSCSI